MKLLALVSLALVGCGMPAPPSSAPPSPDASIDVPDPPDDVEEPSADAAPAADAAPQGHRLRQTESNEIEDDTSVACMDEDGHTVDNSYYRVFSLADAGITSDFRVSKVIVGVEQASTDDGSQPIDVALHTLDGKNLDDGVTELATVTQDVTDREQTTVEFALDATVPAGAVLAVEVRSRHDGDNNAIFFIGANNEGQTAPGYLYAPECGDDEPVDLAAIGYPGVHILIEVIGE